MDTPLPLRAPETRRINLLGVQIDVLPVEVVIDFTVRTVQSGERTMIAYANVHALNLAYECPWFRDFINSAGITYCDGFGLWWGARLLGERITYRFTPPDWFDALAARCASEGISLFLLGARPGVAQRCAALLQARHPGLQVGSHHGYFDKTPGSAGNQAVVQAINAAGPDILVVGFGMPLQERWLRENWTQLDACVAMPVGALFDYLSGEVRRAPHWMTDHGMEWLGRLLVEPGRLWRRYLVGIPLFLWRVFRQRRTANHRTVR